MRRIFCFFFGHKHVSDETWGGYGGTCKCGHNTYFIHDM